MNPDEPRDPAPIDPPDNTRTGTTTTNVDPPAEQPPRKIDPPDNT